MKYSVYMAALVFLAVSCTATRNFTMEDDIYYVPGKKSLVIREVEQLTGEEINSSARSETSIKLPPRPKVSSTQADRNGNGQPANADLSALAAEAKEKLDNSEEIHETLYEDTGYWIGGFKGNESDLPEIRRIIDRYPQGFAFFSNNAFDIAMNLSFNPDWNVYTDNNRYWWFPTSSNINLYSSLFLGTYPKYIWTVIWDDPRFDTWAYAPSFSWGLGFGWGGPGWNFGFNWGFSFNWGFGWYDPWYRPWHYRGWYDPWHYGRWCGSWYDPWYGPHYGYYPGYGYPHGHHSHGYRPGWGSMAVRPGIGNSISGVRPAPSSHFRPDGIRPGTGVRPGSSASMRPGTGTRPSDTRPSIPVRRGTQLRQDNPVRQGTSTRPATTVRPGRYTRPATGNRDNNVKNYRRPQSNYRPTYNTNSSSDRYRSGNNSWSSPRRSSGMYPNRSSQGSRSVPVRNGGGARRR